MLAELGRISSRFRVESVFELGRESCGLRGVRLRERPASPPYEKDYDAGAGPAAWSERFDVSHWGVLSAFDGARRIGAAVLAWRTPELRMLAGRDDAAILWDLRVDPEHRRAGVGSALFRRAEAWALERGCRRIEVETQNVNIPACRFYARQGCRLVRIDASAYPELPHEAQLVWCKELG